MYATITFKQLSMYNTLEVHLYAEKLFRKHMLNPTDL